jgi:phosphoglucan,water dikinase
LAPFEYAAENGFGAFEWLPDKKESGAGWVEKDVDAKTRRYIKDTALKNDIHVSVHAPWHLNPADPDFEGPLSETIGFAEDINASLLTIHLYTDQGIDAYVHGIIPVTAALAQSNIKLSVENTPLTGPEDFNAFFRRLKDLAPGAKGRVGMCLDVGHANLCQATQYDYLRFIDLLDKEVPIIHVHLHENYGDFDSHLVVFTGPAKKNDKGIRGFVKRMKKRAFSGAIILEQWPDPPSLLNQAHDRLCDMFGNGRPLPAQARSITTDGFVGEIVRANRRNRSWRQRLSWIRALLKKLGSEIETDQLAYLAIYLRFIGTGEVPCEEDGRHFRPSHHAKIAQEIFDCLAKATMPENALVIRRIYPWLPSFGRAFTRAEPLTRIRDIAHRNDIPKDLKKEIKHTLQNKLHRCAGPEDLTTSAALLERITASEKGYPPDFVKAFKVFHEQLQEFFNAKSLDEQLKAMTREKMGINPTTVELIQRFSTAKKKETTLKGLAETFELSTALRIRFHEMLAKAKNSQAQRLRTSEIAIEDFSFSLMSQLVNHAQNREEKLSWPTAIRILEMAISNLELSQFHVSECQAIASELAAWRKRFELESPQHRMRLKASLDRCRRLAQAYCDKVLSVFIEKARELGEALGVSEDAINVFCEADIRSHLVFQLSRALDVFLKTLRRLGGISPWDIIVTGRAFGWLRDGFHPDKLTGPRKGPIILLQEKVKEDEAMPEAVVGVIATQAIPHLSHLAIRLRHRRLPCAVCEDKDRFARLKSLTDKWVSLDVSELQVTLKAAEDTEENDTKDRFEGIRKKDDIPPTRLSSAPSLLPLDEIELSTGGCKAFKAKGLKAISAQPGTGFEVPQGVVVPFGVMEAALQAEPSLGKSYWTEMGRLKDLQEPALSKALGQLRQIIEKLQIPEDISSGVTRELSTNGRVVVRSSANSEDLEGTTAAGAYDSIANVSSSDVAGAVRQVWASLWSKRAFMARHRQGIPHEQSHMAVLIQTMLVPEYAFVMHTVNPINNNPKELYLELAVGLGQTLASGDIPGSPYRIICNKHTGKVQILAYASFSQSVIPSLSGDLLKETIDYRTIRMSTDEDFRDSLASRLASIGERVETSMGGPQDIEGVIQNDKIYLVQTRPQLALGKRLEVKG